VFSDHIRLKHKPIKVCVAILAPIVAVGTENGLIFVLNDNNQIVNFLKLKEENLLNKRNFCLNGFGTELILVNLKDDNSSYLKSYKIENQESSLSESFSTFSSPDNHKKSTTKSKNDFSSISKMSLVSKKLLKQIYYPGISLSKIGSIKLSLDMRSLLIYDLQNVNILEYDLNGEFKRILLKGENHLGNVLSFDFSSDRQHLVTAEVELLERRPDLHEPTLLEIFENNDPHRYEFHTKQKNRSKIFNFKLKTFRHAECRCHMHLDRNSRQRSKSPGKDNIGKNNNNPSSFSFYNDSLLNF
jgi:hypothetical protein